MVRNMILLVHDRCMWPRTHPGCPVTHQNVSRVLGKALKIFATKVTLKTIVQWPAMEMAMAEWNTWACAICTGTNQLILQTV